MNRERPEELHEFTSAKRGRLISLQTINFAGIAQVCLERWRMILSCAVIFTFLGGLYAAVTPHIYAATAVITPPPGGSSGSFALSTLKEFARSSADLSSVSASDPQQRYLVFQQLLTSEDLARRMLTNYDFKYEIFARNWDPAAKSWQFGSSPMALLKRTLLSLMQVKKAPEPGPRAMMEFIAENLSVDTDLTSGITTLEFQYRDAEFAKKFLTAVMKEADEIIRLSDMRMLSATVADLGRQLPTISFQQENDALISQLSMMQIQLTQAKVGPQYSYSLIQKPEIEDRLIWPRPLLTLLMAMFLGVVFGMTLAILGVRSIGTWWQVMWFAGDRHKQLPLQS